MGDQLSNASLNKQVASIETKEEEVNKRRVEVTNRVNAQVSRVEAEARRLGELRKVRGPYFCPKTRGTMAYTYKYIFVLTAGRTDGY